MSYPKSSSWLVSQARTLLKGQKITGFNGRSCKRQQYPVTGTKTSPVIEHSCADFFKLLTSNTSFSLNNNNNNNNKKRDLHNATRRLCLHQQVKLYSRSRSSLCAVPDVLTMWVLGIYFGFASVRSYRLSIHWSAFSVQFRLRRILFTRFEVVLLCKLKRRKWTSKVHSWAELKYSCICTQC